MAMNFIVDDNDDCWYLVDEYSEDGKPTKMIAGPFDEYNDVLEYWQQYMDEIEEEQRRANIRLVVDNTQNPVDEDCECC